MEVPRTPWACLYKAIVYQRPPDALGVISQVRAISCPRSHFDVHDTLVSYLLPSAAPTVAVGVKTVVPKSSVRRQKGEALPCIPEYAAVLVKAAPLTIFHPVRDAIVLERTARYLSYSRTSVVRCVGRDDATIVYRNRRYDTGMSSTGALDRVFDFL